MKPEISFLIATRNRGKVICDTIDSLIAQNNKNWEAVIIDDHGDDDSETITKKYRDPRLKYFRLDDDHGIGACSARNFAAMKANSDILAILDSDDIAMPNRTDITLHEFRKNADAAVFYAHLDIWEEETDITRERKLEFTPFDLEKFKTNNFIPHSTVAFKKQVLLDNPYNTFFHMVEDYELLTRLACLGKKFVYSQVKLLKYRLGKNNITYGKDKAILLKNYSDLVHMIRGWLRYDRKVVLDILELEEMQKNAKN